MEKLPNKTKSPQSQTGSNAFKRVIFSEIYVRTRKTDRAVRKRKKKEREGEKGKLEGKDGKKTAMLVTRSTRYTRPWRGWSLDILIHTSPVS